MSSKRVLYKPATKEKVIVKEKRKPLAQGRLVTKPTGGVSGQRTATLQQGSLTQDQGDPGTSTFPRGQLHSKSTRTSSPTHSHPRQRRDEDAPRRETPHASVSRSPGRVQPSHSLDLSDDERDVMMTSQASKAETSIILVDASRQTLTGNTSEVDISLGQTRSPAKVVCHAPSVVHSRLRNSGDVEEARKVMVDHVPSMSVLSYSDYTDRSAPRPVSSFKSPLVVRENTIAGSPIDPHSTAKPTVSKNLFATIIDETQGAGTGLNYSQPRDMSTDHVSEMSHGSISDTTSDITDQAISKSISESTTDDQKRKRKGAHYPTSRYLQTSTAAAKAKSKGPLKATDRAIMGTTGDLKPKRTGNLQPKRTGDVKPNKTGDLKPKQSGKVSKYRMPILEPKLSGNLKPKLSGGVTTRTTPQRSESAKKNKAMPYTTSTPVGADGQSSPGPETSWQDSRYHLTPGNASSPRSQKPVMSNDGSRRLLKDVSLDLPHRRPHDARHDSKVSLCSTVSTIGSNDSRAQKDMEGKPLLGKRRLKYQSYSPGNTVFNVFQFPPQHESNQFQMDLMYAQYLSSVYIESIARKSFKEQEKHVMTDLYGMSELVSEKRKRKEELEQQLTRLRHVNKVDEVLTLQEVGLSSVVPGLEQLSIQYKTLSTALDTTRHQLPTRGVHIPDNADQFIDQLQMALNESEQLLSELSVMTRQKQPIVSALSEALTTLDKLTNEQVTELSKCQQSLAAATTLTVLDCSLLVQDLQLPRA